MRTTAVCLGHPRRAYERVSAETCEVQARLAPSVHAARRVHPLRRPCNTTRPSWLPGSAAPLSDVRRDVEMGPGHFHLL